MKYQALFLFINGISTWFHLICITKIISTQNYMGKVSLFLYRKKSGQVQTFWRPLFRSFHFFFADHPSIVNLPLVLSYFVVKVVEIFINAIVSSSSYWCTQLLIAVVRYVFVTQPVFINNNYPSKKAKNELFQKIIR